MEKAEELLRIKLRQQGEQGRLARRRRRRGRRLSPPTARPARWSKSTARPTSSPRTTTSSRSPSRCRAGRREQPGRRRRAVALPLDRTVGPTVEDVRQGLVGRSARTSRIRRFERFAGAGQARALPARHAHRRAGRVRGRRRALAQGRRDAHRGDEAGRAVAATEVPAGRRSQREREIAAGAAPPESGKPAEIVAKMVEGAVQQVPEGSHAAQPAVREERQADRRADAQGEEGAAVNGFTLYVVGEGIEKKADDFAAEVAAQVAPRRGLTDERQPSSRRHARTPKHRRASPPTSASCSSCRAKR